MDKRRGTIAWFVRNPVAANLVMLVLILGGIFSTFTIKKEVFPDFRLDVVHVSVPYPGASPSEVEQGIILAVEEAIRSLDGIDRVASAALEGGASIYASLDYEANPTTALSDIKNAVDRITSLPEDAERPQVSLVNNRVEVISLILHGEQSHHALRDLAEQIRDELLEDPDISNAELVGAPPRELSIEVSQRAVRSYGLTLQQISQKVAGSALELPGGSVRTAGGEVLLRTTERRHTTEEFEALPLLTSSTGTEVTLGQVATIRETFQETDEYAIYNGEPAIMVKVFRTGRQTPVEVSAAVQEHVKRLKVELPQGVSVATWMDWAEIYQQRVDLLVRNARIGFVLVLIILGLFLEIRLAFWVTIGIPVSFLGAVLLMPTLDVTVNMISLFAFIVVLGMVVDDAIVVGENIFELRQQGVPPLEAAIKGAKGVAVPVCFAIATSVAAFAPMAFVPGFSGKLYRVIPAIVISVLVISLVESLWVLPAHLAALKEPKATGLYARVYRQQQKVKRALERFIERVYAPVLAAVLRRRYVSIATGFAILIATFGFVAGGHLPFRFMPELAGDVVIASVELPFGAPVSESKRIQKELLRTAEEILEENGEEGIVRGIFGQVGTPMPGDPGQAESALPGGHLANIQVFFVDSEERVLQSAEFMETWRKRLGHIAGVEKLRFEASIGPSPGAPVNVELQADSMEDLEAASAKLAKRLEDYPEVYDVDDGFAAGKPQLDMRLSAEAIGLSMTTVDVARQIRSAFYGTEAFRQQEGRNEVKIMVRLPPEERRTIHDVETMLLRTPRGGELAVQEGVSFTPGRSRPHDLASQRQTHGGRHREGRRRHIARLRARVSQGRPDPGGHRRIPGHVVRVRRRQPGADQGDGKPAGGRLHGHVGYLRAARDPVSQLRPAGHCDERHSLRLRGRGDRACVDGL